MLVLEIRFLAGRYAATHFNNRQRAEWPPHPARVFSALTDALHADGRPEEAERAALRWLAAAPPPEIYASSAETRFQQSVYVPPNDAAVLPNIDTQIIKYEEALANLEAASDARAKRKAERALEKAEEQLRRRSANSAEDDGGGSTTSARELMPEGRKRQPRTFPVTIPESDVVHMVWTEAPSEGIVWALDSIASRVARLGHSSSLVSLRFLVTERVDLENRTRWVPDPNGEEILRTTLRNQLELLEEAYQRHRAVEPRVLPAVFTRYTIVTKQTEPPEVVQSVFDDRFIIFEVVPESKNRRRLLLDNSLTQHVTRAMRGLLIKAADEKLPASLCGHEENGEPTKQAHMAIVALSDVGHSYATGTILGVALVLPRGMSDDDRQILFQTIQKAESGFGKKVEPDEPPVLPLTLGRRGVLHVRRVRGEAERTTVRRATWTRPAHRWASVTAVALDRNPGNLGSRDPDVVARAVEAAEATIARACTHAGLPEPIAVWVHRRSLFEGAAAACKFMPFPLEGNGPRRVCVHAEIVFDRKVQGPVLVGAGRYFGLGLFRPMGDR